MRDAFFSRCLCFLAEHLFIFIFFLSSFLIILVLFCVSLCLSVFLCLSAVFVYNAFNTLLLLFMRLCAFVLVTLVNSIGFFVSRHNFSAEWRKVYTEGKNYTQTHAHSHVPAERTNERSNHFGVTEAEWSTQSCRFAVPSNKNCQPECINSSQQATRICFIYLICLLHMRRFEGPSVCLCVFFYSFLFFTLLFSNSVQTAAVIKTQTFSVRWKWMSKMFEQWQQPSSEPTMETTTTTAMSMQLMRQCEMNMYALWI